MNKKYIAKIIKREEIAEKTYEVTFRLGKDLHFVAGQFLMVKILSVDVEIPAKAFSIASPPSKMREISICFRLPNEASKFKKALTETPIGSKITLFGPFGNFGITNLKKVPIIFIAGGVGIVPFYSIVCDSIEKNEIKKMKLIYTDKNEKRICYLKKLRKFSKENDSFELIQRFKRVDIKYLKENCNGNNSNYLICGIPALVTSVKKMLLEMGINKENIVVVRKD